MNLDQHGLVLDFEALDADCPPFQFQIVTLASGKVFAIDGREFLVRCAIDAGQFNLAQPSGCGNLGEGAGDCEDENQYQEFHFTAFHQRRALVTIIILPDAENPIAPAIL